MKKAPSWLFTGMRQWDSLRHFGRKPYNDFDGRDAMWNDSSQNIRGLPAIDPWTGYCNEFMTWHFAKNGIKWNEIPYRIASNTPTGKNTPLGRNFIAGVPNTEYFGIGHDRGPLYPEGHRYMFALDSKDPVSDFSWDDVPPGAIIMPVRLAEGPTKSTSSFGCVHTTMYMGFQPHDTYEGPGQSIWCLGGNQSNWVQPKDFLETDCKHYITWYDSMTRVADRPTNGAYYQNWTENDEKIQLPEGYTNWKVELLDVYSRRSLRSQENEPKRGPFQRVTPAMHNRFIATFPRHYRVYPEGYLVTDGYNKRDHNADPMNMNGVSYNEDFPVFFIHVADDSQVPVLEDHFDIVKPLTFEDHMDKVIADVDPQEARNSRL